MRILLLSAYDARSHRHWHRTLREGIPDWDWQLLSLPPRHFSWRIRGNPLLWLERESSVLEREYDLLLATSMVDLATLKGLQPALGQLPAVLYFHENQFAYPPGRGEHGMLEAQMVTLYSALAADLLLFNSAFNRASFLDGVSALLDRLPDRLAGIVPRLSSRAEVLPVPVDPVDCERVRAGQPGLQLVWNHRWEYDKGPELLLEIAGKLLAADVRFTLHVIGQQFRQQPPEFVQLQAMLQRGGALGHWGFIERESDYRALLSSCDVVLSTATHDFQGLGVLEACAQGCTPVVPDRLVYPEWFPAEFRFADAAAAVARLLELARLQDDGQALPRAEVGAFESARLLPEYRRLLRSQLRHNSVS